MAGAVAHVGGVVPGVEPADLPDVAVVGVVPQVGTADGAARGVHPGVLPAAVAVLGMPGRHQVHGVVHPQGIQCGHLVGQPQRQVLPLGTRPAQGVEAHS